MVSDYNIRRFGCSKTEIERFYKNGDTRSYNSSIIQLTFINIQQKYANFTETYCILGSTLRYMK